MRRRALRVLQAVAFFAFLATDVVGARAHANSLINIYEMALANDPAFRSGEVGTFIGEREYRDALYGYFPRVQGRIDTDRRYQNIIDSANAVFQIGRAEYSVTQGIVELRQPILDYGRVMRVRKGESMRARAFAEFANSRQELILKVSENYFKALAAMQRVQLVESAQRAIQDELKVIKARGRSGQVPRSETKEIEAQAELAVSELIDAQNGLRDRLEALSELTGSPLTRIGRLTKRFPLKMPQPADANAWIAQAVANNHELQSQQLAIAVAGYRRDEALGENLPTLEAKALYDYTDQQGSQFGGGSKTQDTTVGLRLNVPLFNSEGRGYGYLKENHLVQQEHLKLEQLRRKIAREIKDFLNSAEGASRKYDALTRAVEATKIRYEELQAKNRSGEVSSVDVLKAQRDLVRAQRDQFDAIVDYVLAVTRLKARAGTLSEQDIQYFSQFCG